MFLYSGQKHIHTNRKKKEKDERTTEKDKKRKKGKIITRGKLRQYSALYNGNTGYTFLVYHVQLVNVYCTSAFLFYI